MSARLEIQDPGLGVSVQDLGRPSHRSAGVPTSGTADHLGLAAVNALLGQGPEVAALEILASGPTLRALDAPVRLAWWGEVTARWHRPGEWAQALPRHRSWCLLPGESLSLGPVARGVAWLGVQGGWDLPEVLGSRSSYARARLGASLEVGQRWPVGPWAGGPVRGLSAGSDLPQGQSASGPDGDEVVTLRALAGPQALTLAQTHPERAAALRDHLASGALRLSPRWDRMGWRLQGDPDVALTNPWHDTPTLASQAVGLGVVQWPPDGQPIVLGPDAQTLGGYPVAAVIIRADLPRLTQARPGQKVRLQEVTGAMARHAWQQQQAELQRWRQHLRAVPDRDWDPQVLLGSNLISGMLGPADPSSPADLWGPTTTTL